jgi:oligopeptide/dipeptide ABC transporter ATP-binding protein
MSAMEPPVVEIRQLAVAFPAGGTAWRRVVDGVSVEVRAREAMAVVGESGCGKTLTALSLVRLVPRPGRIDGGEVRVAGEDILQADERRLCHLRGGVVGLVFQEPAQALNPVLSVAAQVGEAARLHANLSAREARRSAAALLSEVGLEDTESLLRAYPHQLSGGQRQRVLIACALAGDPRVLVADEPTSALDTISAAHLIALLDALRRSRDLALVLISHDLPLVAQAVDRVTVLYAGETVEVAGKEELFSAPAHPYADALVKMLPQSTPGSGRTLPTIPGKVPDPLAWGGGCRFAPRCPRAFAHCTAARPALTPLGNGRWVRCFLHSDAEENGG